MLDTRYKIDDMNNYKKLIVWQKAREFEGSGRASDNDFAHFLDIAQGSAYEVETQII